MPKTTVLSYTQAVAQAIDRFTKTDDFTKLAKQYGRLQIGAPRWSERHARYALLGTLWATNPDLAVRASKRSLPTKPEPVKVLLVSTVYPANARRGRKTHDIKKWCACNEHRFLLIRAYMEFMERLWGIHPAERAILLEEQRLGQEVRLKLVEVQQNLLREITAWGVVTNLPENVIQIADALRQTKDDEQLRRFKDIRTALVTSKEAPTEEHVRTVITALSARPAGQA